MSQQLIFALNATEFIEYGIQKWKIYDCLAVHLHSFRALPSESLYLLHSQLLKSLHSLYVLS